MEKEYGHIEIRLAELLKQKGLNKYKLSHKAEMNWKQINNYYNNEITRLDTLVLCKLCTALECDIHDLLVFIPATIDDDK
ncbi:MAG: helix-turn-helix transcriptional regulator [Lachnospiraceae bacterium]|nr:helix-turn-helix transcriptional regulator [Lachnospiraceae bacterium]